MTPREVLIAACSKDKNAPYAPLAFITTGVTVDMMESSGAYWPEAHLNPELMARLGAMGYEKYGVPCLKLPFDASVEAGILGARVEYGNIDTFPQIAPSRTVTDASKLEIPNDLEDAGRIPVVLEAIRIQKKNYPDIPIVCHTMGPFATASLIFGFGKLLEWMVLDDENYPAIMEKLTDFSQRYSRLIEKAGADIIQFGEAASSCEVIGSETYEYKVAPYHSLLPGALGIPSVLHICGDITPCMHCLPGTGMDAISYDWKVSNKYAKSLLEGKVKTIGNIDPLGVLLNGTPDTVRSAVFAAMEEGVDVLAPGCCLPPRMPAENIKALVDAHREYLRQKCITVV
ncbi:MAG: MtaA/CmuA family methyltransferase [Candidatus Heteroscillospira sp.]|jgi:MtaA/CmuA family methyltransferase